MPTHSLATSRAEGADRLSRNLVIAVGVVLFHVAALWALQSGLLRRAVEIVVPAQILSEFIQPPAPKVEPPPPPQAVSTPPPLAPKVPALKTATPPPAPAPMPVAIAEPTPAPAAPSAPVGSAAPQPPAPPIAAPVAVAAEPAPPVLAPKPRVELPSSAGEHLHNPKPIYPRMSTTRNEQGTAVVKVLIGTDGLPQKAELKTSSGFERLDNAALATVMQWRYVPGKRGGVPEAMWHDVPVVFKLVD